MPLERNSISVVIITYNSLPILERCIRSVKKACVASDCSFVVVDNASTDSSLETVSALIPEAHIIRNRANGGFAKACNQAAFVARSEYLLFVNPDLEIDSEAIPALRLLFSEKEKVGVVTGRLRYPDGRFQANCRQLPDRTNILFSRGSMLSRLFAGVGSYTAADYDTLCAVPAVAGTFMMIKRELFISIGGFDERFFMYMEDTDLCKRLLEAGYCNYFVPNAGAVHHWGQGSAMGRIRRSWMHHWSVWKYFLKHFPDGFSVVLLPLLLSGNFLFRIVVPGSGKRKD